MVINGFLHFGEPFAKSYTEAVLKSTYKWVDVILKGKILRYSTSDSRLHLFGQLRTTPFNQGELISLVSLMRFSLTLNVSDRSRSAASDEYRVVPSKFVQPSAANVPNLVSLLNLIFPISLREFTHRLVAFDTLETFLFINCYKDIFLLLKVWVTKKNLLQIHLFAFLVF